MKRSWNFRRSLSDLIAQELRSQNEDEENGAGRLILQYGGSRWQGAKPRLHPKKKEKENIGMA